ncbi:hypothetical protein ACW4TU_24020 [Streptomyces sp. QTS52]
MMTSTTTVAGRPQRSRLSRLIRELWFQVVLAAVLGNAVAAIVIGKSENDFDTEQARKVLHSRTTTAPQAESDTANVGADK